MIYTFSNFIQNMAYLAIIAVVAYFFFDRYHKSKPKREHIARKRQLASVPAYQSDEDGRVEPAEAARQRLRFMGLPSVSAGGHIQSVPSENPEEEGKWAGNVGVISTAKAMAFTKQGPDPLDLTELDNGRVLVAGGGKVLLMTRYDLTSSEADDLQNERQEAVDRGDGMMKFTGHSWRITGAFGSHANPKAGERSQSYMQVLTVHPRLGEVGFISILPPSILDLKEHDYYDMRARQVDGDQILYAFYVGGKWICLIGRVLPEEEVGRIKGI